MIFNRISLLCLGLFLSINITIQAQNIEVEDIRLLGLQSISPATVFHMLPVNLRSEPNAANIRKTIKKLFATGYFKDIDVLYDNKVLVIKLIEYPTISDISVTGNKKIPTEPLKKSLEQAGLSKGNILQVTTLNIVHQSLKKQYQQIGYYAANVAINQLPAKNNTVNIKIVISEGEESEVITLDFIGNKHFTTKQLQENFNLKTADTASFFSSDNKFNQELFFNSIQQLQKFYQNNGFYRARITDYKLYLNKNDYSKMFVTITLDEGILYKVEQSTVTLESLYDNFNKTAIEKIIDIAPNSVYSQAKIDTIEININNFLKEKGYFSPHVKVTSEIQEAGLINLNFAIDTGKRSFVRNINFVGNNKTQSQVLRRELRQFESAPADNKLIALSTLRLQRLPYIKNVRLAQNIVANTDDQIDLTYHLEEQFTGSISANLAYSSVTRASIGASYTENNILGSGKSSSLSVQYGKISKQYSFAVSDPYFTIHNTSLNYNLFYRSIDYDEASIGDFTTNMLSLNVGVGYPINETTRLNFGINLGDTRLTIGRNPYEETSEFVTLYGKEFTDYALSYSIEKNTFNRGFMPTKGTKSGLSIQANLPFSDLTYYRSRLYLSHYLPLYKNNWLLKFNSELGYIAAYGKTKHVPIFKNFYAGGFGSLRGYQNSSVGPNRTTDRNTKPPTVDYNFPAGGNILTKASMEFIFPHFWESDSIRTMLFIDAAQVYNDNCLISNDTCHNNISFMSMRKSWGISLVWFTPLAPLQFSIAFPLNKQPNDRLEQTQFTLGYGF